MSTEPEATGATTDRASSGHSDDASVAESRSARRRRETKDIILDAAEQRFLDQGFHRTRVHEVALDADVSVGSIYVHFAGKEGLYAALLERAVEIEERYISKIFDSGAPEAVQIFAVGEAYLRFFHEHPSYFRMLVFPHDDVPAEAARTPLGVKVAERGEAQMARMASVIAACQEQGIVRREVDPRRAAMFMWAAWNGVVALTLRPDRLRLPEHELEAVIDEGRRMLAEGIATMILRNDDLGLKPEFTPANLVMQHEELTD